MENPGLHVCEQYSLIISSHAALSPIYIHWSFLSLLIASLGGF